jgi:hypothetical protein
MNLNKFTKEQLLKNITKEDMIKLIEQKNLSDSPVKSQTQVENIHSQSWHNKWLVMPLLKFKFLLNKYPALGYLIKFITVVSLISKLIKKFNFYSKFFKFINVTLLSLLGITYWDLYGIRWPLHIWSELSNICRNIFNYFISSAFWIRFSGLFNWQINNDIDNTRKILDQKNSSNNSWFRDILKDKIEMDNKNRKISLFPSSSINIESINSKDTNWWNPTTWFNTPADTDKNISDNSTPWYLNKYYYFASFIVLTGFYFYFNPEDSKAIVTAILAYLGINNNNNDDSNNTMPPMAVSASNYYSWIKSFIFLESQDVEVIDNISDTSTSSTSQSTLTHTPKLDKGKQIELGELSPEEIERRKKLSKTSFLMTVMRLKQHIDFFSKDAQDLINRTLTSENKELINQYLNHRLNWIRLAYGNIIDQWNIKSPEINELLEINETVNTSVLNTDTQPDEASLITETLSLSPDIEIQDNRSIPLNEAQNQIIDFDSEYSEVALATTNNGESSNYNDNSLQLEIEHNPFENSYSPTENSPKENSPKENSPIIENINNAIINDEEINPIMTELTNSPINNYHDNQIINNLTNETILNNSPIENLPLAVEEDQATIELNNKFSSISVDFSLNDFVTFNFDNVHDLDSIQIYFDDGTSQWYSWEILQSKMGMIGENIDHIPFSILLFFWSYFVLFIFLFLF